MDTATPIYKSYLKELKILELNLPYKDEFLDFSLFEINNSIIKLLLKPKDINKIFKNYSIELDLEEFQNLHKYFKMFDNFQDFKIDFVNICKSNNFKIINMNDDELIISINLHLLTNNSINLTLKSKEISQKKQIQFLLKDLNDKNKKIEELNIKINELENGHKSLEKIINNLLLRIQKFENNKVDNNNDDVFGSKIILNEKELNFISKAILPEKNISLKLLFSSDKSKENIDELKSAYIGKNDILFLIKTTKNKRFGGYAHESFENYKFKKYDKNAFLFNINKLEIYRANKTDYSIWSDIFNDSINFGHWTDLRINLS